MARARRVIGTGAALLALVLVALAAAAWRLVEAEEADAAVRGRSAAALAVDDLVRELGDVNGPDAPPAVVLAADGTMEQPVPPRRFRPMPPLEDAEGAFLIRESASWGWGLRRAALLRAMESNDRATSLSASAAGMRLGLREGLAWSRTLEWSTRRRTTFDDVLRGDLEDTREGMLLRAQPTRFEGGIDGLMPSDPNVEPLLAVVGSEDDVEAASIVASLGRDGARRVRERRAALAEANVLVAAFRHAPEVDGSRRAAMVAGGDVMSARLADGRWRLVRVPSERVQQAAWRVLSPRSMRLVRAPASSAAAPMPGDDDWSVVASFASGEARSRSTLLLAGLGIAAASAALAFAAFARSVRREARMATLRTEFVATVSHELRTPVAVVRTSAETLAAGRAMTDADKQTLTSAIVRESERLSDLVGNVLDFARMEAGRRTYAFRETDVGALVRDVASRHAGVDVEVAPDLPRLRCDADAIGAAVTNLLDNARKFSERGVRCALRAYPRNDEVSIDVVDHGIGVPEEEKSHVFERFFRGADPRVRETRGAGIGLALVQHAAQAHGGRVEIVDTPGGGATFRIVLPVAQNEGR